MKHGIDFSFCHGNGCERSPAVMQIDSKPLGCASDWLPYCVECARQSLQRITLSLLRPLHGRIVVLPDAPREKSHKSLIIVPRTMIKNGRRVDEKTFVGTVVGVGPGWAARRNALSGLEIADSPGVVRRKPMDIEVGQRVIVKAEHEESIPQWRGLALAGEYAVLGFDEPGFEDPSRPETL